MNGKRLLTGFALASLLWLAFAGAASAQYSYKGVGFTPTAPVPQSTGLGTFYNFFNNTDVDSYGLPANLVFGAWFSTYISQGAFMGPNGNKVAGAPNGGNLWANVAWFQWIYPIQPDNPSWRFAFNAFMPIIAATTGVAGPTQFWFSPLITYYSYHQFRYLRDSTVFGPYISLPVGGGFGFTPANGQVNQYNFTALAEGWYQFQHMDELAVGNLGLGWLNTLELQPFFTYTHQLNSTPGLPASAVFSGGIGSMSSLGITGSTIGGYMPGDNIDAGGIFSYGLKQINPALRNWRIGIITDSDFSVFQNTWRGSPIKNTALEMVDVGPSIQYAKGDFVLWFYYATNVMTQNYYGEQQFFLQLYYFFNL